MTVRPEVAPNIVDDGAPAAAPSGRRPSRARRTRGTPYLLLLPAVVVVAAVLIYPLLANIVLSFFNWRFGDLGTAEFVGWDNFQQMFTDDPMFWSSVRFTLAFTAVTIAIELVVGIGSALLLNQLRRGRSAITTVLLVPFIAAPLSVGTVWKLLYRDPSPINWLLSTVGLPQVSWLSDPTAAFWAVVISEVWRSTPFVTLIMLASLAAIPPQLAEAAKVDGANVVQRFRTVTLPLLRPAITVVLVFLLVFKVRVFDLVVALTAGGPANSTMPLGLLLRQEYFLYLNTGKAAAIGVVLLLFGALTTLLCFGLVYRRVEY